MDLGLVGLDFPKLGSVHAAEKRIQEAEELSRRRLQELLKVTKEKKELEEKLLQIQKLVGGKEKEEVEDDDDDEGS